MRGKKKEIFVFFLFVALLVTPIVFASDVAYIYRTERRVDDKIVNQFENLGLSVDFIQEGNVRRTDLSSYKLIFVGDERFITPGNIPVGDYPSIIVNYRHGEVWGLTDGDGISSLARNSPLEVNKNGQIIQVYTQAFFRPGNSLAIPYYYLSFLNIDPDMIGVAEAYNGGDDIGEVIAYSDPGNVLRNGHLANEKICFYGIVKSEFWTPAAANMFNDCIDFVASACSTNSDCGDVVVGNNYCSGNDVVRDETAQLCENAGSFNSACVADVNQVIVESCEDACVSGECVEFVCETDSDCDDGDNHTQDTCNLPGTLESFCVNEPILCLDDSECGNDSFIGDNYCLEGNVVRDFESFMCLEAGSVESSCTSEINPLFVEACAFGCFEGSCLPDTRECIEDSDCGVITNEFICIGDDRYEEINTPICTESNECSQDLSQVFVEACAFGCFEGECVVDVECTIDSQCGETTIENTCVADYLFEVTTSPWCTNQNTCSQVVNSVLIQQCEFGCSEGSCNEGECLENNDCGEIDVQRLCVDDDVYEVTRSPMCTLENECTIDVSQQLVESCEFGCEFGECLEDVGECLDSEDCGVPIDFLICNGNVLTERFVVPICSETFMCQIAVNDVPLEVCTYGCSNGSCNEGECLNNSDCGTSSVQNLCVNDDVYEVTRSPMCTNNNQCLMDVTQRLKESCEFGCEFGECLEVVGTNSQLLCVNDELYEVTRTRVCNSNGRCENIVEQEVIEVCENSCILGACVDSF